MMVEGEELPTIDLQAPDDKRIALHTYAGQPLVLRKVRVAGHAEEVLEAVRGLA